MTTIFAIVFLILGFIVGSFLNVVIIRLNTQKSFGGRSKCMHCRTQLSWYELFPVFSFLFLRGKCKTCKTKISWQYPFVELVTGIIFACLFLKFQDLFYAGNSLVFAGTIAYYASMFSILIVIAVYDIRHKIIPDMLSLIFGILALAGLFFFSSFGFHIHFPSILEFLSGIIICLPFVLLWLVSRGKWMGLGDGKLAVGLGWLLGLSRALSGIVLAFWTGAIIGLILLAFSKKHGMKSEIPFAPFLVLGAILAFLFELHLFPIGF